MLEINPAYTYPHAADFSKETPRPRGSELQSLGRVLDRYGRHIAGLIGPYSTEAVRQGQTILEEVSGAIARVTESPGTRISFSGAALGCPGGGRHPYEYEVFYARHHSRQPHLVFYPQNEGGHLEKIDVRLVRIDTELMSKHLGQPTASIILPHSSTYSFWETSLGPLRIKTARLRQIEGYGLGFHPEHEIEHAIVQCRWPEFYYLVLNRLSAYDEALAELASIGAYRSQMVDLEVLAGGATLAWEEPRPVAHYATAVVNSLPNGHPARWVQMLGGGAPAPGAVFEPRSGPVGTDRRPDGVTSFGNGLHEAYVVEIDQAALARFQPMEFADLMGTDFRPERYPQTMCFALFFEDFLPAVSQRLRQMAESWGGGRLTLADLQAEPEMVTGWLETASPDDWYRLYGYRGVDNLADLVFGDLQKVAIERRHDLSNLKLPELEELFWRHWLARLITESYPFRLARMEENPRRSYGAPTPPQQVARVVEVLTRVRVPLRDSIEKAWLEKGADHVRRRLRKAKFVTLPGRE